MKKMSVGVLALFGVVSVVMADGAALYQKCATCHGKSGERSALGNKSKIINQMGKAEIAAALKGYQDGSYGGASKSLMLAKVKGLDDATITAIAEYIGK